MTEKQTAPENPGLVEIEASQVAEADKARLTFREVEGNYVIQASDGTAIPKTLTVVDATGLPWARYVAEPVPEPAPQSEESSEGRLTRELSIKETISAFMSRCGDVRD